MISTRWGDISHDYKRFSFRPRWGGECEPIASDGHFLTDGLTVNMIKNNDNRLCINSVVDDDLHTVDLEPGILKMLDLQGRVRYNESLKYILKI